MARLERIVEKLPEAERVDIAECRAGQLWARSPRLNRHHARTSTQLTSKGTGIRMNVLSPGAVDDPSLRIALEGASGADTPEPAVMQMGEGIPIGRLADPREIGKAAVFLSSDASSFVTRIELLVDGGMAQTG